MSRALSTPQRSTGHDYDGSLAFPGNDRFGSTARTGSNQQPDPEDGPSLVEAAIEGPKILALGGAIFGLLGLLLVVSQWSSYHASARVILRDPWEADIATTDRPVGGDFQRFVRSQARFMQTDDVLDRAAKTLSVPKSDLASKFAATASPSGDFVEVSMGASSGSEAVRRLDAVLAAYGTKRLESVDEQSSAVLDSIATEIARQKGGTDTELSRKATNLRIAVAAYGNGISFVEQSPAAADLGKAKKLGLPFAGAIAGIGLAAVAVWIQANRYPQVRDPQALARRRRLGYLGSVATIDADEQPAAERVATEATLLALAGTLRQQLPRGGNNSYAVVLVAGTANTNTLAVSQFLAQATQSHGAVARVVDADGRRGPLDGIDVQAELNGPRCDLVLFACGAPQNDFVALKLARDADAVIVVVPENAPTSEVDQGLTFFDNVGLTPHALIATKHLKAGR